MSEDDDFTEEPTTETDESADDDLDAAEAGVDEKRVKFKFVDKTPLSQPTGRFVSYICDSADRVTSNEIQLPEATEAIGIRASQIEMGARYFVSDEGLFSPIEIATREFISKKSPLILRRAVESRDTYSIIEEWKVREMHISDITLGIIVGTSDKVME